MHQIINDADQCIVLTGTSITEKLNFFYTLWNVVHYEIIQQRNLNSRENVNIESVKTKLPTMLLFAFRELWKEMG